MTTTLAPTPITSSPVVTGTDTLLDLLHDSLSAIEEQDPDSLHSTSAAGRALVSLSSIARQAAGALGSESGVCLADAAGVVVVRDLVSATRLLSRAASRGASGDRDAQVSRLVPPAKGMHATLLEAMTADV